MRGSKRVDTGVCRFRVFAVIDSVKNSLEGREGVSKGV